ncbi:MAG: hypothetical protein HDT46_04835 [Ruminococcaceae bacterium]|nr:hypothetical protein [Oscillospiraceae bacterium]
MQQEIIKGISKALNAEFGSMYTVYAEKAKQGVQKPCFFIKSESTAEIPFPMGRYFHENIFSVTFYPKNEAEEKIDCVRTAERLFGCLEYITVSGDLTRGSKMSCRIEEGVLKFTLHYDMFVYKPKEKTPKMGELHYNRF